MPTTAATGLCAVAFTPFAFLRAPASFGLLWRAGLLVLLPLSLAQQQPQEWPSLPPMSGNPLLVPHAPSAIPAGQAVPLAAPSSTSPGDGIPTLHAPHTAHPRFRCHAPDFPSLSHDTPDRLRPHRQTRRRATTRRTTSGDRPRQSHQCSARPRSIRRHHRRRRLHRHPHRQLHSSSSAPSPRTTRQS